MITRISDLLEEGKKPVRIVCFGDSITGVYYHTGGRRAYPEMLEIALRRLCPAARVSIINSGVSGNTTEAGLARIESDVLSHQPHRVTVMFGMNDAARLPVEAYHANLKRILGRCCNAGSEVLLCTPNSIHDEDSSRPVARLREFAQVVRNTAEEEHVALTDCWQAFEEIRSRYPMTWKLLLDPQLVSELWGGRM